MIDYHLDINRINHFLSAIESKISSITDMTVLSYFDMNQWKTYQFPFAYAEIDSDNFDSNHEDSWETEATCLFSIWVGIENFLGEDVRTVHADIQHKLEKTFKNWSITPLRTSDIDLSVQKSHLQGQQIVFNDASNKLLYIITGEITYTQKYL